MLPELDSENLYNKAKLYYQKAKEEGVESYYYPLFISLSLEFLLRSALAHVHPVLLADPNDDKAIIHVFLENTDYKDLKSILTVRVINRLLELIPDFGEEEKKLAISITSQRNAELHSGESGFEFFPSKIWIDKYYKLAKKLVDFRGNNLEDFFGKEDSEWINSFLVEADKKIEKELRSLINSYKKVFDNFSPAEKKEKLRLYQKERDDLIEIAHITNCPACNSEALLTGKKLSVANVKLVDGQLKQDSEYLPDSLRCYICGLKVEGHNKLIFLGLGEVFKKTEDVDPIDHFGLDVADFINGMDRSQIDEIYADMYGYMDE